ncbi:hypothetical protein ACJJTC_019794 [Scirpophaga incertulas]
MSDEAAGAWGHASHETDRPHGTHHTRFMSSEDSGCNGDKNAEVQEKPLPCPSTCKLPNQGYCNSLSPPANCVCKSGYILDRAGGKCISVETCPGGNPCGQNKTFVSCKVQCPIDFCPTTEDERIHPCELVFVRPCPSGCVCQSGYKNTNGKCVLPEDCPPVTCTRENEEWNRCPSLCFSDSCYDVPQRTAACNTQPTCFPKCRCKPEYARADNGTCIRITECHNNVGCPKRCKETCAAPNPKNCARYQNKCSCGDGLVFENANSDKCINIYTCPENLGCDGDPNAVIEHRANPVRSTCRRPKQDEIRDAPNAGCVCKDGYILDTVNGSCIPVDNCPRYPCGRNETFSQCSKECPYNYCPTSGERMGYACAFPSPCPNGCVCKRGYLRNGQGRCVLGQDCPPVPCKANEEWNSCPGACSSDSCEGVLNPPKVCETLVEHTCHPICWCKPGYGRDNNDVCIPVENCQNLCCNGDPNAVIQENPIPVRSTCRTPNQDVKPGPKVGCVCKDGYILDKANGSCIPVNNCPISPCGRNETFSQCRVECPFDFCPTSDERVAVACDYPYPCPNGCVCKRGYLRNGQGKCILGQDCPPVRCTRPNEEWNSCPGACSNDSCDGVLNPPKVCQTLLEPTCNPICWCKPGYGRDNNDVCIPVKNCR